MSISSDHYDKVRVLSLNNQCHASKGKNVERFSMWITFAEERFPIYRVIKS